MRIHIISQIQWTPYFKRSAHFERKNLQMKDDLSELDDFFTVIKLHYLKERIIPKLSNTKFGLVEVTETTNIQGSFHLHSCSAKELVLKICQNSLKETCTKVFFLKVTGLQPSLYLKTNCDSGIFMAFLPYMLSVCRQVHFK